jgi:hypothetical protein
MGKWFLFFLLVSMNTFGQSHSAIPLRQLAKKNHNKTNLTKYLNTKSWNKLFPNRYGVGLKDSDDIDPFFYSFDAFVSAAKLFPDFLNGKTKELQKKELAAFLANISQETSGGEDAAPDDYFKWGLYFLEENVQHFNYIDTASKRYPGVAGKYYFGRGPCQLSWNYNYGQFSEAWYGSKDTLLQYPELLSKDPVLSFASAIWFWMTAQNPKPSCHDIIVGKWIPTPTDIEKGRLPGFATTLNVINGGLECGKGYDFAKSQNRYGYYIHFCSYFKISPGDNISCSNQKPFGQ